VNWPEDADGDVIRRMREGGFDFSKPCLIDFNVDFQSWPPPQAAIRVLEKEYPSTKVYEPTEEDDGYVQFQLFELLSYELVTRTQEHVTKLMTPYGGICESWGVLH
jgi:hypothetical protein